MRVARRMASIPFSGIRKVFEEVTRREGRGQEIIHLEIGRPDFDTPNRIKEAAKRALDAGKTHYSSNYGIPELRRSIARKMEKGDGLVYDPTEEIIVTVGANEAVFMAMMALLDPGDEVLIPDPCWPHYFYCAEMAGAKAISVPLREENGFNPSLDDFRARLSPRTRMIVINSPHNPTGAVFERPALAELGELACERELFVLSDEIYGRILYDGAQHTSVATLPAMRERTVVINGFSKIYAMTGWRLGYVAAPAELIAAMVRVHQYTTVCAPSFCQWGAVEALDGPQTEADTMVAEFARRRDLAYHALSAMPGIRVVKPRGAFYILPNIQAYGRGSLEMTEYLLDEAQIAVVPGASLGAYGDRFVRISYANSYDNLARAFERMARAMEKAQAPRARA